MKKTFLYIALFWIVIILLFVGVKEYTLQTGTEVLLKTQPVDPRDLFRGDYVILSYEISSLDVNTEVRAGQKLYVPLTIVDGYGVAGTPQFSAPEGLFIKGESQYDTESRVRLEYGIESYFVPENQGRPLERNPELEVLVAIDSSGNAVIKKVFLEGEEVTFE